MGASSSEIDKQIRETREHLEANLSVLEQRAVSSARRVGRIAAMVGAGLVAAAGIGFAIYQARRRRSRVTRIQDAVRCGIYRDSCRKSSSAGWRRSRW